VTPPSYKLKNVFVTSTDFVSLGSERQHLVRVTFIWNFVTFWS